jgi:excinuclease ABC subunit C
MPSDIEETISGAFIRLIYAHISFLPEQLVLAKEPGDWDVQKRWFLAKGSAVKIVTSPRGVSGRLLKWAEKNAENDLAGTVFKSKTPSSIMELKDILKLDTPPRWIEAFDVSNLGDKFAVGASVAFRDGKPYTQRYRHYRIKRTAGQNDFAMINEIVGRRLKDLKAENRFPDLLLIDGGKGQLSAALAATRKFDVGIPVLAIAKRSDELYYPDGRAVSLPTLSRSVFMIKRLRNEAHRFVINYHRKIRAKSVKRSVLDDIPGIGAERKLNLLKYFGSVEAIKKTSEEEIAMVPKIGKRIARIIHATLHD